MERLGKFQNPLSLLIGTESNNPKADFCGKKSQLGSVSDERAMHPSEYRTSCSIWDAYILILIANRSSTLSEVSKMTPQGILDLLEICRIAKRQTYTDLDWVPTLLKRIPSSTAGKSFIVSWSKYMGLGPQSVMPGDSIVILNGMEVPSILWKGDSGDESQERLANDIIREFSSSDWKDCSQSFLDVHGIMDGELYSDAGLSKQEFILV